MTRLDEIEQQLDVLERRIRALEDFHAMLQYRSAAAQPASQSGILQEV